jgi:hypothetical protein
MVVLLEKESVNSRMMEKCFVGLCIASVHGAKALRLVTMGSIID